MPHCDPDAVYAEDLRPWPRVQSEHAAHTVMISVAGQRCAVCQKPATHKIGEHGTSGAVHEMTAYLCCEDFRRIGCDCSQYPYDLTLPAFGAGPAGTGCST